ncbi:hypothetical protein ACG2LH_08405 [Zhouia sp. PK063]|uniref:hypothetical protein n=1 Tax=Zhouia sp. PK063 TaxID=3373602 RepID=UPI00379A1E51
MEHKILKWLGLGILTILFTPYLIIGFYTALLSWSNDHQMWKDSKIYTNSKNEKVISQWRETSGSIYDYRDRKIIAEFGQFRISYNHDIKNLKGIWTEYDIKKNKTTKIHFNK